jgi:bifunctional DNA-binding transcriptional regulator/antitoxin component of YhaV-PrlF toxin-antitoxin module
VDLVALRLNRRLAWAEDEHGGQTMRTTDVNTGDSAVTLVVGPDGRLSLPAEILRARSIEPGDSVEVEITLEGVLVVPVVTNTEAETFWGRDWEIQLDKAEADIAAGHTTFHGSTEEFLTALDAGSDAHPRRDR